MIIHDPLLIIILYPLLNHSWSIINHHQMINDYPWPMIIRHHVIMSSSVITSSCHLSSSHLSSAEVSRKSSLLRIGYRHWECLSCRSWWGWAEVREGRLCLTTKVCLWVTGCWSSCILTMTSLTILGMSGLLELMRLGDWRKMRVWYLIQLTTTNDRQLEI